MEKAETVKISVVIPIYNMETYLSQCLDSVISQNLKDIEILCVNDGSTDNSESIIKTYMKNDGRIKLISQENQGVANARNNAMRQAQGEFIAFMDPDDWYPDADVLQVLYDKARKFGMLIVGGSFSEWTNGKLVTKFTGIKKKYTFENDGIIAYRDYQFDYGYHRFIYQTRFLRDHNIYFPPYIRFQDPPFFVKAMITAGNFYAVHKVTYCYRVGTQQIVWTDRKLIDLLKGLRDLLTITSAYRLKDLHCLTLQRLGKNYALRYADALPSASDELIPTLQDIEKAIDISLICDNKELMQYRYISHYITELSLNNQRKQSILSENPKKQIEKPDVFPNEIYSERNLQENSDLSAPFVSVIIPVYNVENYIAACVKSVCSQTLENIEIILVNDGTPDHSMDKVSSLIAQDNRIKTVNKENGGLSSARNAGIQIATGEYLLFLDSDDLLCNNALEHLYNYAKKLNLEDLFYSAEVLFEDLQVQKNNSNYVNYYKRRGDYPGVRKGTALFTNFIKNQEFKPSACLQLLKRTFLEENHISFYEGIIHEDNLFTMQCLLKATRTGFLDEELYRRRVHENSIMTQKHSIKNAIGYYVSVSQMLKFVEVHTEPLDECYLDSLMYYLSVMVDTGANFLKGLSSYELTTYSRSLPASEQLLFHILFIKVSHLKQELYHFKHSSRECKEEPPRSVKELQREIDALKNSESYKVGRIILYIPRKVKQLLKKLFRQDIHY